MHFYLPVIYLLFQEKGSSSEGANAHITLRPSNRRTAMLWTSRHQSQNIGRGVGKDAENPGKRWPIYIRVCPASWNGRFQCRKRTKRKPRCKYPFWVDRSSRPGPVRVIGVETGLSGGSIFRVGSIAKVQCTDQGGHLPLP